MKNLLAFVFSSVVSVVIISESHAESLRCNGDIVDIGDSKADVVQKCGNPEMTDSFCEKYEEDYRRPDGKIDRRQACENVDIWTYNPGKGQFWTHLYFIQGKLREMRYGDRVK